LSVLTLVGEAGLGEPLLGFGKVSEKEFLGNVAKQFSRCPLCGSENGFKVGGLFAKTVDCRDCGTGWLAGTMVAENQWSERYGQKGEPGLKILYAKGNRPQGKILEGKPFKLSLWLREDQPLIKFADYGTTIVNGVERFQKIPGDVGKIKIEQKHVIQFYGPSGHITALVSPSVEPDEQVKLAVVDYTPEYKENVKALEKNEFFNFLTGLWLYNLELVSPGPSKHFDWVLYTVEGGEPKIVEKNMFRPFDPGIVNIPGCFIEPLAKLGIMHPQEVGLERWTFW
jgi:hypothetical protein